MDGQTGEQTDRRTDVTKLIVIFRNLVNVPKTHTPCTSQKTQCVSITNINGQRKGKGIPVQVMRLYRERRDLAPPTLNLRTKLTFLMPNVKYSGRTAPLTSKVAFYIFIQQI